MREPNFFRQSGRPFGASNPTGVGSRGAKGSTRTALMKALGSVVYAARLADGTIKIGWTETFHDRMRYLKCYDGQDVELLAFLPGGHSDEQAIHAGLVAHRIEGRREYYHPTADVLAVVNDMRTSLRLPPIAA
jgi:hypothetical protein